MLHRWGSNQIRCRRCFPVALLICWIEGGMFAAGVGFQRFHLPPWPLPLACAGCSSSSKTRRQMMTLHAAQVGLTQAEEMSVTQIAYIGDPLYQFHGVRKGRLLQQPALHDHDTLYALHSLLCPSHHHAILYLFVLASGERETNHRTVAGQT